VYSKKYYRSTKSLNRQQFLVNVPAIIISRERMPHTKPQSLKEKKQINENNFCMSLRGTNVTKQSLFR
jgi:hypothetical protein